MPPTEIRDVINPKQYPFWSLFEKVMLVPQAVLNDGEKALLCRLYLYASKATGAAWPKRQEIARVLGGLSISQIDRRLAKLEETGFIRATQTGQKQPNCYEFLSNEYLPALADGDDGPVGEDVPAAPGRTLSPHESESAYLRTHFGSDSADMRSSESAYPRTPIHYEPTIEEAHSLKREGAIGEEGLPGEAVLSTSPLEHFPLPTILASPSTRYPTLASVARWLTETYRVRVYTETMPSDRFQRYEAALTKATFRAESLDVDWREWLASEAMKAHHQGRLDQYAASGGYAYPVLEDLVAGLDKAMMSRESAKRTADKRRGVQPTLTIPAENAGEEVFISGMSESERAWRKSQKEGGTYAH